MRSPRHDIIYPDHELDCEAALEPVVVGLVGEAEAAGWDRLTLLIALATLAIDLANEENDRTDAEIDRVNRRFHA